MSELTEKLQALIAGWDKLIDGLEQQAATFERCRQSNLAMATAMRKQRSLQVATLAALLAQETPLRES